MQYRQPRPQDWVLSGSPCRGSSLSGPAHACLLSQRNYNTILLPCGVQSYSFTSTFGIHFPRLFVPHVAHPSIDLIPFHIITYNFNEMKRVVTVRVVYYVKSKSRNNYHSQRSLSSFTQSLPGAEHNDLCFLPLRFTLIKDHDNSGTRASNWLAVNVPHYASPIQELLLLFNHGSSFKAPVKSIDRFEP